MTNMELEILSKFKKRTPVDIDELIIIEHLEKMGLMEIDRLSTTIINGIVVFYAKNTDLGNQVFEAERRSTIFQYIKKFFK